MSVSPSDLRRAAARAAQPKRRAAHKAYRPIHWNRIHKLASAMPDRAQRAFWALLVRSREIQSGIVYIGNKGLGSRVDRCGRTIQRAKPQLRASGLVIIHAGGGKMINEHGQVTEAATGYELADVLFRTNVAGPAAARPGTRPYPAAVPETPRPGAAGFRELAERFKSRAGP